MKAKSLFLLVVTLPVLGLLVICGDSQTSNLTPVSGATLDEKLQWLAANAVNNTGYLLELSSAHEAIAPHIFSYGGSTITLFIKGRGNDRVITPSTNGSLFTINNGVTLILENITLAGMSGNNDALVHINSGGSLQLNQGAKITRNSGDGIVNYGGVLTMTGGEISGNLVGVHNDVFYTTIDGLYTTINGVFTMSGGKVAGNTGNGIANNGTFIFNNGEISDNDGGGVFNLGGTFTMKGGKIAGNSSSSFDGGGVHNGVIYTIVDGVYGIVNGNFTMSGGEISGNIASNGGGVSNHGIFNVEGGQISGNTASIGGGVDNHGTFTMKGGRIAGNTAFLFGGGVSSTISYTYAYDNHVPEGSFSMRSGEISNNSASSYGGGVFISDGAVFEKTGGTISNNAVYAYHDITDYIKQKDTNAGPLDNLTYNGKRNPPSWNGKWDN